MYSCVCLNMLYSTYTGYWNWNHLKRSALLGYPTPSISFNISLEFYWFILLKYAESHTYPKIKRINFLNKNGPFPFQGFHFCWPVLVILKHEMIWSWLNSWLQLGYNIISLIIKLFLMDLNEKFRIFSNKYEPNNFDGSF